MMADKTTVRKRRGSGAVTLNDVAKIAGVAPITASRALNKPDQVSPEVLQRVKEAVDRTGYVPNRMAGGLASAKSKMIVAIVPSAVSSVFMDTIEALNNTLFDSGYQLMLGQSGYSADRQEMLIESFIGRRPDGIFLTGVLNAGKGRTKLLASGIPIIETWDLTSTPMDMLIGFSHSEVGRSVAQFLLKKKRTKFAVITGNDERAARRYGAFCEELKKAGIKKVPVEVVGSKSTMHLGRVALGNILDTQPGTQAVFCSSDVSALGVLAEAHARGIRVPEQLAVVGFGDGPYAADTVPGLTSVRVNGSEIGALAARCLIQRAEGEEVDPRIVDIGFSIIERGTT
jgi:LacI family gluconate utilization system Gnt-I transcriptional repressor